MWIATTKIWAVKDSLKRVVDYASYPEKTEYSGLANALHYAKNDVKTELCETVHLVSGLHCRPEQAWDDMRSIQEHFGKTGGTVALHAYQSFKPGEVTPEQCHAIGVELARKMWGGRFQVLVATHLNTNCLHNHFVINSVSYIDGKKYEQKRSQYYDLRTASDDICRAHELSVIKQPLGKTPRQLYEAEQRCEPTRYNQMRAAIHEAKAKTSTERDFARALDGLGYVWSRAPNRKYATLCARDGGRAVRVYRLGAEYDWPAIEAALHENFARWGPRYYDWQCNPHHTAKEPQRAVVRHTGRYKCRGLSNARKPTGLWRMYEKCCEEVNRLFARLYEDWASGRLTEYNFTMLSSKYQAEQQELRQKILDAKTKLDAQRELDNSAEKWVDLIRKYAGPTELTAELLNALIEKIRIHEAVKLPDGSRQQKVEIFYRFIGNLDANSIQTSTVSQTVSLTT